MDDRLRWGVFQSPCRQAEYQLRLLLRKSDLLILPRCSSLPAHRCASEIAAATKEETQTGISMLANDDLEFYFGL